STCRARPRPRDKRPPGRSPFRRTAERENCHCSCRPRAGRAQRLPGSEPDRASTRGRQAASRTPHVPVQSCGGVALADTLQGPAEAVAGLVVLPDDALEEGMTAGLLHQLDMGVERQAWLAAGEEMRRKVERHVMAALHPGAEAAG